jgi:hypothetical protein
MSAKIWKGWGGVRFVTDDTDVTFSGASGNTIDKPIKIFKENDSYNIIPRIIGTRMTVITSNLFNVADSDYTKYVDLAEILTYLIFQDEDIANELIRTVTIYPRYDSTLTTNLSYICTLKSDISASDISLCKTGQVMDLEWIVLSKQSRITTFISDTEEHSYWDGTTEYWDGTTEYGDGLG